MSIISKIKTGFRLIESGDWREFTRNLRKNMFPTYLPILPDSLLIELTNVCNLHCPACPTGSGKMNRPGRMMQFNEFKNIIDQIKGHVTQIFLHSYGESFLNRDFLRMVQYGASADISLSVCTNGQFIKDREFARNLVKSGLHHLAVALDGVDQETNSKFRRGSDFNLVIEGIKLIVEAKRDLNSKTPLLELQFIVMKHNEHQLEEARKLAGQLGMDIFNEKMVGIDYSDPDFERLAAELLPTNLSHSRFELRDDGTYALKGKIPNHCSWAYSTAVVNSDGTVLPCCYDLYSQHIMGNVFHEKLKDIWNNRKYRTFRKMIRRDRKSISICRICSEGRYAVQNKTESVKHMMI